VSGDNAVILWDLTDRTQPRQVGQLLIGHAGLYEVAFSPDGHTLATASRDTSVILWDLIDSTQPRQLGQPLTAVSVSPELEDLRDASGLLVGFRHPRPCCSCLQGR
jgi:WD40 repeat protein